MTYEERVLKFADHFTRNIDTAVFTGWASGRWETFSRCCSAQTYVKFGDYYAGIPSCSKCDQVLGPSDFLREWVPPRKLNPQSQMECPWPMEPEDEL